MPKQYFLRFYEQVERHLGIVLNDKKQYLLESRLLPLVKKTGHSNVASLVKELTIAPVGVLHWEAFEALTTNETSFFRDEHVFQGVRDHVLPKLIECRKEEKALRIWSAASSSGQEAYSIAMLILESFPELREWKIDIQGTDVSPSMIQKAKLGIYSAHEVSRGISPIRLQRHFKLLESGSYQLNENIRDLVIFTQHNLVADWVPATQFDLVVMRNVLIYFNQSTKDKILEKIHKSLSPQFGILMLGSSEALYLSDRFKQINEANIAYYEAKCQFTLTSGNQHSSI